MNNKIISDLEKDRDKIYSKIRKIDNKIVKEQIKQSEKEKQKYVGKYFKKKGYDKSAEYVKVIKFIKGKGFEVMNVDVEGKDLWISRYVTYRSPEGLIRCSKELFEKKLKKGLIRLK